MNVSTSTSSRARSRSTQIHPAIRSSGLRKRYGDVEALRGVDLEVARGEVLALLGPNGAGKTTTVEILEGFRSRERRRVRCSAPTRTAPDRVARPHRHRAAGVRSPTPG